MLSDGDNQNLTYMKLTTSTNIEDYKKEVAELLNVQQEELAGRVFVVIDENLKEYFSFFDEFKILTVSATERDKSLTTVKKIYDWLLEEGAERSSALVGVGGGVITDVTGFVAATYMRGMYCVFIPTTLLAQCDASLGGKNGFNLGSYKNIVGTIREPDLVFVSPKFLKTLPFAVFKEGIVEMLKTFLVADAESYHKAVDFFEERMQLIGVDETNQQTQQFISRCQEIKLQIVKEDLYGKGRRALLNFGHTYGHALESVAQQKSYNVLHGQAVAVGIIWAVIVSQRKGICTKEEAEAITNDFKRLYLPINPCDIGLCEDDREIVWGALQKDKKRKGESIDFIFFASPGNVFTKEVKISELEMCPCEQ